MEEALLALHPTSSGACRNVRFIRNPRVVCTFALALPFSLVELLLLPAAEFSLVEVFAFAFAFADASVFVVTFLAFAFVVGCTVV